MAICRKKKFFLLLIIFFLISNFAFSEKLNERFKERKVTYLEFILSNLENKTLLRSKILVFSQLMPIRVQYQSIGSQVKFLDEENKILITIVAVMDQRRYKLKRYKPKLSDCNIVRNLIFFNQHGYGFFQKRNKYLDPEIMKENFINNFLNNMYLNEDDLDILTKNIDINVEIISPIKGENFYCSGNLFQDEIE